MKTLVALGTLVGYMLLRHAEQQYRLRVAAYGFQLELWNIRQQVAFRRALDGEPYQFEPPPRWQG